MTAQAGGLVLSTPSDLEITITRTFGAPATLVFDAWTRCELLRQWWGMPHMPIDRCKIDLRPGGHWRYVMRSPDRSAEIGIYGTYREVDRPARLVSTEAFEGAEFETMGGDCVNTMVFEQAGSTTAMVFTSLFRSKEARDRALQSGFDRGLEESFQYLDEHFAAAA